MITKQKGDIAEAHVLAHLLKKGKTVLHPFGDRSRYDLVVDENGKFTRVQVKSGRIRENAVEFNSCSVTTENGAVVSRNYRGQVDIFAVYCHDNECIYMVPVAYAGTSNTRLCLTETRRGNQYVQRSAQEFLVT